MNTRRCITALALVALGVVSTAGTASAATRKAYAGPNAKVPDTLSINKFYPSTVTIHPGDSVSWQINGFHNVTVPKKGTDPGSVIAPTGQPSAGYADPNGAPFWFNGLPQIGLIGTGALPAGGKTYSGAKLVTSGLPFTPGPPKPFRVKFTKTGTYSYYCTLHPGMKATVKVVSSATNLLATAKSENGKVRTDSAKDIKTATQLDKTPNVPANTISGGSDKGKVNWLKFYPSTLSVPAGTALTFTDKSSSEPHTLTFASDALVTQITNPTPPTALLDSRAIYPSDPLPLPPFDGTNHGGFYSTGVLGPTPGAPKQVSFVVTTPGVYQFHCLIHPAEMKGTLTVT